MCCNKPIDYKMLTKLDIIAWLHREGGNSDILAYILAYIYIYIYISQRSDKKGCMVPSILQFQFKINIKEGQDMHKNVVYLKSL